MIVHDLGEREPRPGCQFEYVLHVVASLARAVDHLQAKIRDLFFLSVDVGNTK